MDQFRMEEEMARLVSEKEAVEAKNKGLERRLANLQADFVSLSLPGAVTLPSGILIGLGIGGEPVAPRDAAGSAF